jgi:hypothetical protein
MPASSIALLLLCPLAAQADSWAAPQTTTYDSAHGTHRFTTIPPGHKGNPEIDRKKARCFGRLEQKQKDGSYTLVWEKHLSNIVSPVSALVSDGGDYVVTFDNWHSVGRGNNVVVIYGPKGKLVRELGLRDFLTDDEVMRLPNSVSSTWWGEGHVLDEKNGWVGLKVKGDPKAKEVRLRLETGKVVEAGNPLEQARPPRVTPQKKQAVASSADDTISDVTTVAVPDGGKPAVARVDGGGTIHLLYNSASGPRYVQSSNNGKTFEPPVPVLDEGSRRPGLLFEAWDMAVGRGNRVHVAMGTNAWQLKLPEKEWGFYYTSLDAGAKAFAPVRNINGTPSEGFSLAADDKGAVVACWLSGKLYANVSHDGGKSFGPPSGNRLCLRPLQLLYHKCGLWGGRETRRVVSGGNEQRARYVDGVVGSRPWPSVTDSYQRYVMES